MWWTEDKTNIAKGGSKVEDFSSKISCQPNFNKINIKVKCI